MVNSLSLGRLESMSAALPCAAIFSGGRNLTASPACQFRLPPGPAVAREIVFSHFPPVRLACDSALAVIDLPQPEKTALVAPADPKIFKSVRRSVVVLCSDMYSTPWVSASQLVQGFSICSLEALFRHPSSESRKPSNRAVFARSGHGISRFYSIVNVTFPRALCGRWIVSSEDPCEFRVFERKFSLCSNRDFSLCCDILLTWL